MKILIVEDDVVSRMLLQRIIQQEFPGELKVARNGREAWEMLEGGYLPELCISDILMPQMDGFELLHQMRSDHRFKAVPVILCTALNDRGTVTRAATQKVRHYILKPYTAAKVIAAIKDALAQTSMPDTDSWGEVIQRLGLDRATCAQLVNLLAEEIPVAVATIRQELKQGNRKGVVLRLEALRSAALNLADEELTDLSASLLASAEKGDIIWPEDLARLEKQQERLKKLSLWLGGEAGAPPPECAA